MSTIEDTLKVIPSLQNKLSEEMDIGITFDYQFLCDIHNYLGIYYFDLLAHACMNNLSQNINIKTLPSAYTKYHSISMQEETYQELIKSQNISGLFFLWIKFEQFIYRHSEKNGKQAGDFKKAHRDVMEKSGIKRKRVKVIEKTFTGIRRTRNSLHSNGIYFNEDRASFEFTLKSDTYVLEDNKPVRPLRLIHVIQELLDNYYEIQSETS